MSEETPLLTSASHPEVIAHDRIYQRFSRARKQLILSVISLAGLLPLFVSGTFVSSIPQIAQELDTTGSVISLAISLSVFTNCIGTLVWSNYSSFCGQDGRRPIYIFSSLFLSLSSFCVANVSSVRSLLLLRVIQAFGSSSALSVGMGVIGDIYKLEERGTATGTYLGFILLGPAIAPVAGGIAAHYYSWRSIQIAICMFSGLLLVFFALFLPETSHPGTRGIDKLIDEGSRPRFVLLNPFSSLRFLRSPNILLVAVVGGLALLTDYVLLVPIAYTIGRRYNISNEALIGALFIPNGVGNLIGAYVAGRLSDKTVAKWREHRAGVWVPEDRLRVTLFGALFAVPLSLLSYGLITENVRGTPGIVLDLVCLFVHGVGLDWILSPCSSYLVDVLHSHSAEAMAANLTLRGSITSLASALVIPSVETIGLISTNTIAAMLVWVSFGILWSVIKYGDRMRAYVDVGFSTAKDN
ncbi:hypothetical protein NLI96_g9670 [Meripilus lineatus]|uniref:Major facilitator superfamily (MFS) profile domain-containing protein n=1 Tax=Meripilus lineatus TaxID=2056292 RepID=A0AAD5UXA4_9APHY|nr:hypothetical protein NLI96_g9670 [Physisporinus lineatus]